MRRNSKAGARFVASGVQLSIAYTESMHVPQIGCRLIAGLMPTFTNAQLFSLKSFPAAECIVFQYFPPLVRPSQCNSRKLIDDRTVT